MAEQFVLTTPVTAPTITGWHSTRLDLNFGAAIIHIELTNNNGKKFEWDILGAEATNLMIALSKANLTNNSLQKRIMTYLIGIPEALSILGGTGTIIGSPD